MSANLEGQQIKQKYGPWAVIAGASDGTGEAFARQLAAAGVNVILAARREDVLNALADDIRAAHGVETRVLVQDLMAPDAAENMLRASADVDVGLYVSNAGADGTGSSFFQQPLERWHRLTQMNVLTLQDAVYGFGNRMRERGGGGILVMISNSALGGTPYLSMYSATKAFGMALCEALWGELAETHIDLLGVLAPAMNTPMFQREVAGKGFKLGNYLFEPDDIAAQALASLGKIPILAFPSPRDPDSEALMKARFDRLRIALDAGKSYVVNDDKIGA